MVYLRLVAFLIDNITKLVFDSSRAKLNLGRQKSLPLSVYFIVKMYKLLMPHISLLCKKESRTSHYLSQTDMHFIVTTSDFDKLTWSVGGICGCRWSGESAMRACVSCGLHTAVATAKELVPYLQSISGTVKFITIPMIPSISMLGQTRETDFFVPLLLFILFFITSVQNTVAPHLFLLVICT